MKALGALIDGLDGPAATVPIGAVAIDHRQIVSGTLFGAFRGARFNAEDVIPEAIAKGAVAVIARPPSGRPGAVRSRRGRRDRR